MTSDKSSTNEIFLLSDKSSGSTIFEYELLRHPKIVAVKYTPHNDHETLFWLKAAVLLGRPTSEFFEGSYPFSKKYALKSIKQILTNNVPDFVQPLEHEQLVIEGWKALCKAHDGIFFEKSPHHLNHWASTRMIIDYALQNPDVKIIGLVRDPISVVYSTLKRWYVNPVERQSKWSNTYQNLMIVEKLLPPAQFILVRYEDVVKDAGAVYKKVCTYLNIEFKEDMGKDVHSNSKEKWRGDQDFYIEPDDTVKLIASYFGYTFAEEKTGKTKFKIDKGKMLLFKVKNMLKGLINGKK